jgi:hypothetical protein
MGKDKLSFFILLFYFIFFNLNLDTDCKLVVMCTLRRLYPWEKQCVILTWICLTQRYYI